MMEYDLVSLL